MRFMLSSACSVGIVSSCSWWDSCCEIIGTLSGRKICGVLSSVCVDPLNVGYIFKSSVDTWHGSKNEQGVGAGVAIFSENELVTKLKY